MRCGRDRAIEPLARLPVAINGKPKYSDESGTPFQCHLTEWRPDNRYTLQEIVDGLQLELAPAGRPKKTANPLSPPTVALMALVMMATMF